MRRYSGIVLLFVSLMAFLAAASVQAQPVQWRGGGGGFRRAAGETFFDVVRIDAGDATNPPSVTSLGIAKVAITFPSIVDPIKNVVYVIGTGGVSVGAAQ